MRRLLLVSAFASLMSFAAVAQNYTFTVNNNSDTDIVRIEVSEDAESWSPFQIGGGIAAEDSAELMWDSSTDNSDCNWQFRATFRGGFVAYSDWIDFCEDDVVIDFDFD
jgi:hypothetical protein